MKSGSFRVQWASVLPASLRRRFAGVALAWETGAEWIVSQGLAWQQSTAQRMAAEASPRGGGGVEGEGCRSPLRLVIARGSGWQPDRAAHCRAGPVKRGGVPDQSARHAAAGGEAVQFECDVSGVPVRRQVAGLVCAARLGLEHA